VTGHDLRHATRDPLRFGDREAAFLETCIPGIFAAGDVRSGSTKQVASASGEGATAALLIREYIKSAWTGIRSRHRGSSEAAHRTESGYALGHPGRLKDLNQGLGHLTPLVPVPFNGNREKSYAERP